MTNPVAWERQKITILSEMGRLSLEFPIGSSCNVFVAQKEGDPKDYLVTSYVSSTPM
jgi:hypothetical protein